MVLQTLGKSPAGFWIQYYRANSIIILWNWRLCMQLETLQKSKLMHFPQNTGLNTYKRVRSAERIFAEGGMLSRLQQTIQSS